jgi:hypothetical protein
MSTIVIGVGSLAVLFAFGLFYRLRRLKPQAAGYASQRMCPACGLITPRSAAACLECGKPFLGAPVVRQPRR